LLSVNVDENISLLDNFVVDLTVNYPAIDASMESLFLC